jgi:hypothetical protein
MHRLGKPRRPGSITSPATRQAPRAGVLSPYQPPAQDQLRVEAGEQSLDDVGRQLATRRHQRRQPRQGSGRERALGASAGMKVPGRGQQRQPGNIVLAPQRQCQRQQPAHAVADHRGPPAGFRKDRVERGLEPAGDVIGEREIALRRTRSIPIDQERAQAPPRGYSRD